MRSEEKAMKSKISFCNIEIIRNNLRMYSLLSLFWGIFLFIMYPLMILRAEEYNTTYDTVQYMFNSGFFLSMVLPTSMGLVFFGFLKSENATAFYMSLPTTKTQLFVSQYISATILYLVPLLLNAAAVFIIVGTSSDGRELLYFLIKWLVTMTLFFLINFTISAGIGVITGSTIWNILFVIVYFVLPAFLGVSLDFFTSKLILGLSHQGRFGEWFRTVDIIQQTVNEMRDMDPISNSFLLYLLIYAVVVVVLHTILYHSKKMENNKDWIGFTFFKYFFIVGFTTCMAFVVSMFFSELVFRGSDSAIYIGTAVGSVLGYVIAAMIAFKTIYLKKYWWGTLISLVLSVGILGAIDADVFGLESRVPAAKDVVAVKLYHRGFNHRDMERFKLISFDGSSGTVSYQFNEIENIEKVRQLHQLIVKKAKSGGNLFQQYYSVVRVMYQLGDGKELYREYQDVDLSEFRKEYEELLSTKEALMQEYPILQPSYAQAVNRIRVATDFNNSEEVLTDAKKKEFLALVQEELFDFVAGDEMPEILGEDEDRILLLKESPIRITFEEAEVGQLSEGAPAQVKPSTSRELNESVIVFKGKAPKIRKWLRENSQFHSQMIIGAEEIAHIDAYEVAAYDVYDIRYHYGWRDYMHFKETHRVEDRSKYDKLVELSGDVLYRSERGMILLDIHLKNGTSVPRVIRHEEYKAIIKE